MKTINDLKSVRNLLGRVYQMYGPLGPFMNEVKEMRNKITKEIIELEEGLAHYSVDCMSGYYPGPLEQIWKRIWKHLKKAVTRL